MCSGTRRRAIEQSGLVNPEDTDITILRNVDEQSPSERAPHLRRRESAATPLQQPHLSTWLYMHCCVDRIASY